MLTGSQIILGVTGSIAAFKAIEVLRLLTLEEGARVTAILTRHATQFVAPLSFSVPPPVLVRPKPVAAEMTPESSVVAVLSVCSVRDSEPRLTAPVSVRASLPLITSTVPAVGALLTKSIAFPTVRAPPLVKLRDGRRQA